MSEGTLSFVSCDGGVLVMERGNGICCAVNTKEESMRVHASSAILCHNTTSCKNVHYIHKHGFVLY